MAHYIYCTYSLRASMMMYVRSIHHVCMMLCYHIYITSCTHIPPYVNNPFLARISIYDRSQQINILPKCQVGLLTHVQFKFYPKYQVGLRG